MIDKILEYIEDNYEYVKDEEWCGPSKIMVERDKLIEFIKGLKEEN